MSQQVLLLQVNTSELEDGRDAAHRLATQKDEIVGSTVGRNPPLRCLSNIACISRLTGEETDRPTARSEMLTVMGNPGETGIVASGQKHEVELACSNHPF